MSIFVFRRPRVSSAALILGPALLISCASNNSETTIAATDGAAGDTSQMVPDAANGDSFRDDAPSDDAPPDAFHPEPGPDGAAADAAVAPGDARDAAVGAGDASDGATREAGSHDAATHDSGSGDAGGGDGAVAREAGTGGVGYTCTGASPSLGKDVWPLLNHCSGERCHGGVVATGVIPPWGGPAKVHDYFVNKPATMDTCSPGMLVTPGDLSHSYLLNKLTGIAMCPGTLVMPAIGIRLPKADIQTVADWICSGAPNN